MNNTKCYMQIVTTESYTHRMMEATKEVGQRDVKGDTKGCFIFGGWLSSEKL